MMDLDEAIQHCEEVAETNERICDTEPSIGLPDIYKHKDEAKECAFEHRQLAEWLKELKAYKENTCGDAISRRAVLNAMYELCDTGETLKENPWRDNPHIDGVVEAIEELPSVTPRQRIGQWERMSDLPNDVDDRFECSRCGNVVHYNNVMNLRTFNRWCGRCGSDNG